MANEDTRTAGRKRPRPEAARISKRVACFLADPPCKLGCQEAHDKVPKEVRPLNAGHFMLEAMRQANVASAKARSKRKGKVRGK